MFSRLTTKSFRTFNRFLTKQSKKKSKHVRSMTSTFTASYVITTHTHFFFPVPTTTTSTQVHPLEFHVSVRHSIDLCGMCLVCSWCFRTDTHEHDIRVGSQTNAFVEHIRIRLLRRTLQSLVFSVWQSVFTQAVHDKSDDWLLRSHSVFTCTMLLLHYGHSERWQRGEHHDAVTKGMVCREYGFCGILVTHAVDMFSFRTFPVTSLSISLITTRKSRLDENTFRYPSTAAYYTSHAAHSCTKHGSHIYLTVNAKESFLKNQTYVLNK